MNFRNFPQPLESASDDKGSDASGAEHYKRVNESFNEISDQLHSDFKLLWEQYFILNKYTRDDLEQKQLNLLPKKVKGELSDGELVEALFISAVLSFGESIPATPEKILQANGYFIDSVNEEFEPEGDVIEADEQVYQKPLSAWYYPGFENFSNMYEDLNHAPTFANFRYSLFQYSIKELNNVVNELGAYLAKKNFSDSVSDVDQLHFWFYKAKELLEARQLFENANEETIVTPIRNKLEKKYARASGKTLHKDLIKLRNKFVDTRDMSNSDRLDILAKIKVILELIDQKYEYKQRVESRLEQRGIKKGAKVVGITPEGFIAIGPYDGTSSTGFSRIKIDEVKDANDVWVGPNDIDLVTSPPPWWLKRLSSLEGNTDRVIGIYHYLASKVSQEENYNNSKRKLLRLLQFPEKYLERPLYEYTYEEISQKLIENDGLDVLRNLDNHYRDRVVSYGGNIQAFDESPIGYIQNWKNQKVNELDDQSTSKNERVGIRATIKLIDQFINQVKEVVNSQDEPTSNGGVNLDDKKDDSNLDSKKTNKLSPEQISAINKLTYDDLAALLSDDLLSELNKVKNKLPVNHYEKFKESPIALVANIENLVLEGNLSGEDLDKFVANSHRLARQVIGFLITKHSDVISLSSDGSEELVENDNVKYRPDIYSSLTQEAKEAIDSHIGQTLITTEDNKDDLLKFINQSPALYMSHHNIEIAESIAETYANQSELIYPDDLLLSKLGINRDAFDSFIDEVLPVLVEQNRVATNQVIGMSNRLMVHIYHQASDITGDYPYTRVVQTLFTDPVAGIKKLSYLRQQGF